MQRLLIPMFMFLTIANVTHAQDCIGTQRVDASYELVNNDVCEGFEITVRNTSEEFGNTNTIYIWDWGDGQRDTLDEITEVKHTYNFNDLDACSADGGLAIAELRLSAIVPGCPQFNHFVIKPIFVFLRPVAQFEADATLCLPETTIDFKNTSCTADTGAIYRWDFGDPASGVANTSTEFEPSHTFSGPGLYTVSLTVQSNCGNNTFSQMIEVKEAPVVNVTYSLNPNTSCAPLILRINNQSAGAQTYEWNISPGQGFSFLDSTSRFSISPTLFLFESGTYKLTLRMTNECGPSTWEETIEVFEQPLIMLTAEPIACEELIYTPKVEYAGTVSQVRWTFNGGTPATSTERNPSDIIFPPGQHVVQLEASSVCGTFTLQDTLIVLERQDVTIEPVAPLCNTAQPVQLSATPTGGVWSGTGVTADGRFDPSDAILGVNTITYSMGAAECLSTETIDIEVKNAVPINPGSDQTVCIDAPSFQLTGFSPNGGYWQGMGITDTAQAIFSPAVAGIGSKPLTYFYFDETNSCIATAQKRITVAPLPNAAIAEDEVVFCITNENIRLRDNLTLNAGPNGFGVWTGAGIVNAAEGLLNTSALSPGRYTLTYTHTSDAGCIALDSFAINITAKQQVVVPADTTVCISAGTLALQFAPTGGRWSGVGIDAGTGVINLQQAGGGTTTYTYTIFGGTTCEVRDEITVNVIDLSGVNAGADVGFCESEDFVNLSAATPSGGIWSGDGLVDAVTGLVDIRLLEPGDYTFTYRIESSAVASCAAEDQLTLTVHPLPQAGFTLEGNQCINESFTFVDTSVNADSYAWDFGDGRTSDAMNPQIAFDAAGDYTVTLLVRSTAGCEDVISRPIRITEPPPTVAFDVNTRSGCADLEVAFTNLSRGENIDFVWNFGNGQTDSTANPQPVIYTAEFGDSTYVVRLSVANGCGAKEYTDTIRVSPRPIANFGTTFSSFCSGDVVEIQNASQGLPDSYFWDFGNGRTSRVIQPDPQIYFTADEPTTYTISLIAANSCGSDTLSKTLTVEPTNVRAFFSVDQPEFCVGDTVQVTSFATPGADVSYVFGDGTTSSDNNPEHIYNTAGVYNIIQYSYGCGFDSTVVAVNIKPLPEIELLVDDITCLESETKFDFIASDNVSTNWSFGDGNISNIPKPVHTYDSIGTYLVRLSVVAANRCRASVEKQIRVTPLPQFDIVVPDSLCVSESAQFRTISSGSLSSVTWIFGDGEQGTGQTTSYAYSRQGSFTVTAMATDAVGCMSTQSDAVFVRPTPEAAFNFTVFGECVPTDIVFDNQSKTANGYQWNFRDGATSTRMNPRHTYLEGGDYEVDLIATYDGICYDTTSQMITINGIPNIEFRTKDITCFGADNGSIEVLNDQGNNIAVYGDDFFQQGGNLFSRLKPGFYDIEATAASGCDTTYTVEISEPDSLIMFVRLDTVRIVPGDTVRLEIFSNYSDLNYTWFPDTSIVRVGENLFYAYPQRSVLYELTGTTGECSVRDFVYVEVDRERKIYIPSAFSPNGDGINDFFYVFAGDGVEEVELLQIYQRFGDMVYQKQNFDPNDPSAAWDGTFKGKKLDPAVFVYRARIRFKDGETEEFVGDVTLVR